MPSSPISFSAAVEGPADEVILRRVVESLGATLGPVFGKNGKPKLLSQLNNYNQAAHISPWIVVIGLDGDAGCAPTARAQWLANPAPNMCFRIAVRAIESWILADRESLAAFLGIAESRVPFQPETLINPKEALVNLARGSRRRSIRVDMTPRPASGRSVGPAYTSRLNEYAQSNWRPDVAAHHADSLQRLCNRLLESFENLGN